jgi:hypothetical protein
MNRQGANDKDDLGRQDAKPALDPDPGTPRNLDLLVAERL